jgi:hypothetical protein
VRNRESAPRPDADLFVCSHRAANSEWHAVAAEDHDCATDKIDIRVLLKEFALQAETLRVHDVVAIHPSEKPAGAEMNRLVQPGGQTAVIGVDDQSNARVGELSYDIGGIVG